MFPENPIVGQMTYSRSKNILLVFTGSHWVPVSTVQDPFNPKIKEFLNINSLDQILKALSTEVKHMLLHLINTNPDLIDKLQKSILEEI